MMTKSLHFLRRFTRRTDGNIPLEAVIVFPALMVIFAAAWLYFDMLRQVSINHKANYTIADMLSRETDMIDDSYIDNARELLFHLTKARGDYVDLRVTAIQYNEKGKSTNGTYDLVWSEARGDWSGLTESDVSALADQLPIMAAGDQFIYVETRDLYLPIFSNIGLSDFDIEVYSFTRPRFSPQIIFEGVNDGSQKQFQNNGWGNGDQDAPGGSLCNNNAENADEGAASASCTGSSKGGNGKGKKNSV
ncbi:TadE/TadG family type IV pilus assembly protein [Marivita sp. S2033]|uniref:TadE/TadG family type IV pilus assembly protein n=1 Tax=Marivita sp. S2033 TaxID=3373187 RepID=UPI003982704A